jgi:hypothetical protein
MLKALAWASVIGLIAAVAIVVALASGASPTQAGQAAGLVLVAPMLIGLNALRRWAWQPLNFDALRRGPASVATESTQTLPNDSSEAQNHVTVRRVFALDRISAIRTLFAGAALAIIAIVGGGPMLQWVAGGFESWGAYVISDPLFDHNAPRMLAVVGAAISLWGGYRLVRLVAGEAHEKTPPAGRPRA